MPFPDWVDSILLANRAGDPIRSDEEISLVLLAHLGGEKAPLPPTGIWENVLELIPVAKKLSGKGEGKWNFATWLGFLLIAAGSQKWKEGFLAGANPWNGVWPNARAELENMATWTLSAHREFGGVIAWFDRWVLGFPALRGAEMEESPSSARNVKSIRRLARRAAMTTVRLMLGEKKHTRTTKITLSRWKPQLCALPTWIAAVLRGQAGEGHKVRSEGAAFPALRELLPELDFKPPTALLRCTNPECTGREPREIRTKNAGILQNGKGRYGPTFLFHQAECDDCHAALTRIEGEERFVVKDIKRIGTFLRCHKCQCCHYHPLQAEGAVPNDQLRGEPGETENVPDQKSFPARDGYAPRGHGIYDKLQELIDASPGELGAALRTGDRAGLLKKAAGTISEKRSAKARLKNPNISFDDLVEPNPKESDEELGRRWLDAAVDRLLADESGKVSEKRWKSPRAVEYVKLDPPLRCSCGTRIPKRGTKAALTFMHVHRRP